MDAELAYLLLICTLLVLPKALQRLRIPEPLSAIALGVAASALLTLGQNAAVHFAAVLGIAALFLHAGLEVNADHLRAQKTALIAFSLLRLASIAGVSWLVWRYLSLPWQAATLFALAVLTSSTGFILDSLDRYAFDPAQRVAIANEAITGELLALALMFVVLQSDGALHFAGATAALAALVAALPLVFIALWRWIVPHAPGSQFSLLVMVAVAAAAMTERLGVEMLLGAFLAGLVASWLQARKQAVVPQETLHAVKLFYTFFLPFYFFRSGTAVPLDAFGVEALGWGFLLCLLLPGRVLATRYRRRLWGEAAAESSAVATTLMPTLIFTVVMAQILLDRFALPQPLYGGLLIYAFVNTLLPSLLMRVGLDIPPRRRQVAAVGREPKTAEQSPE